MPDAAAGAATAFPPSILATAAPAIPAARAWAAAYRGAAGPAIDLTQAVPGYPPHPDLLLRLGEAAARTANAGYGPIEGETGLREALAADLSRRYRAPLDAADVVITAGCNLAFAMAMTAIAGPAAAVLLPAPWYFNHHMALTMLGIAPLALPCRPEDGFVPDPERAVASMDGRVRALVLATPNTPHGRGLSARDDRRLCGGLPEPRHRAGAGRDLSRRPAGRGSAARAVPRSGVARWAGASPLGLQELLRSGPSRGRDRRRACHPHAASEGARHAADLRAAGDAGGARLGRTGRSRPGARATAT